MSKPNVVQTLKSPTAHLSSDGSSRATVLAVAELLAAFQNIKEAVRVLDKSVQKMNRVHHDNEKKANSLRLFQNLSDKLEDDGEKHLDAKDDTNPKRKTPEGSHQDSLAKRLRSSSSAKDPSPGLESQATVISSSKRLSRCMKCKPCLKEDCGKCQNCKKKKKFGGKGTTKSCVKRNCKKLKTVIVTTKKSPQDENFSETVDETELTTPTTSSETPPNPLDTDAEFQSIRTENASARKTLTRQLFRCTSFIQENIDTCEALIAANHPERKLAVLSRQKHASVADLLGERRFKAQAQKSGVNAIAFSGEEEHPLIEVPEPTTWSNGAKTFLPREAIRHIAHNNLSDDNCKYIVDAWIEKKYIPVKRELLLELVDNYYLGETELLTPWSHYLPLTLPLDTSENGWSAEEKASIRKAILNHKGVQVKDMDVTAMFNKDDTDCSDRPQTENNGSAKVDTVDGAEEDANNKNETSAQRAARLEVAGLEVLAEGAEVALHLPEPIGDNSDDGAGEKPKGSLDTAIELIKLEEALKDPIYKKLLTKTKKIKPKSVSPNIDEKHFGPVEAIAHYMHLSDKDKKSELIRWQEEKFIPFDKQNFHDLVIAFYLNEPIPTSWLVDWKKVVEDRTNASYKKQAKDALRLIKDGYVPVPPASKKIFTPLEVGVILTNIDKNLKNRIMEIWISCNFVQVTKRALDVAAQKYEKGQKVSSRFTTVGRPSANTMEKAKAVAKQVMNGKYKKPSDTILPQKTQVKSTTTAKNLELEAKKIALEEKKKNYIVPVPPNNKNEFTPLEAFKCYETVPADVRMHVRFQWMDLKYIPCKNTAFKSMWKKYKDGEELPESWQKKGRPSKVNLDELIEWAKDASKLKGEQITRDEFKAKVETERIAISQRSHKMYWDIIKVTLDSDPSVPKAAPPQPKKPHVVFNQPPSIGTGTGTGTGASLPPLPPDGPSPTRRSLPTTTNMPTMPTMPMHMHMHMNMNMNMNIHAHMDMMQDGNRYHAPPLHEHDISQDDIQDMMV